MSYNKHHLEEIIVTRDYDNYAAPLVFQVYWYIILSDVKHVSK